MSKLAPDGDRFVLPGMHEDIAKWIRKYRNCSRAKVTQLNTAPLSSVLPVLTQRFIHVYVDLTGPLPKSHGYSYLMMTVGRFSRFVHAISLVGISASECTEAFIYYW